jgi:hypothetical protein
VRAHQVNQRAQEAEELEGLVQEREELDNITLRRELKVLSTREISLDHCEADLERERKALEDTRAQSPDPGQQARQLAKLQMQELAVT